MKICFWGNIACALRGETIGGGELQISLLAKALALAGHEVVVIDPHILDSFTTQEGIKVLAVPDWNKGPNGIRLFRYRIPRLYKMMAEQKADYYYVRMRIYLHIVSYLAAKKAGGKFLISLASDIDPLSFWKKFKYEYRANFNFFRYLTQWLPNDVIFKFLVKRADFVLKQHDGQIIKWKKKKGKTVIFPNIINLETLPVNSNDKGGYFIYAGSVTMLKGAKELQDIVKSQSGNYKVMIVGQPNDVKAVPVYNEIKKMSNGSVKGRLEHFETLKLISNAKALINTSNFEGFPNVFLEAWGMGVPVLSLKVNPGNVFNKYNLGQCFDGNLESMKEAMMHSKNDFNDCNELTSYVHRFHDFKTAADRFVSILK